MFARIFSASGSGEVFYLFTVFAIVIQFASLSLESGVAYRAARNLSTNSLITGFWISWTVAASLVTIALFTPVARLLSLPVHYPILYPAAFISGNLLIAFGNAFCYAKLRFVEPGLVALVINVSLIALLTSLKLSGRVELFIPWYFVSFLVHGILLCAMILIRFRIVPSFRFSFAEIRSIFHYSLQAFAGNLLFLLLNRADYFIVHRFCPSRELGNYIQVSRITQLFFLVPSMIASVLFPVMAGQAQSTAPQRVRTVSAMILIGYTAALLLPALAGSWLFPALYGSSFRDMYIPFLLGIPGILAISSLYPYTAYYAATNRQKVNVAGASVALIIIVVADLLFVPVYGIAAAAITGSMGYLAFYVFVVMKFKAEFRLPWNKLFILNRQEYLYIMGRFKP